MASVWMWITKLLIAPQIHQTFKSGYGVFESGYLTVPAACALLSFVVVLAYHSVIYPSLWVVHTQTTHAAHPKERNVSD